MARHGVHCLTNFRAMLARGEFPLRRGLDAGDLDRYLVVDIKREPFRRLVV